MSISKDFLKLIKIIEKKLEIPPIKEIFVPSSSSYDKKGKKHNFGAVILEDFTIGVVFLSLDPEIRFIEKELDLRSFKGKNTIEVAKNFALDDGYLKTIGLGAFNAISQHIFKKTQFEFDFTTDPFGLLNFENGDNIGMVGFFPPLVRRIINMDVSLIVIEKKTHFVQYHENWEVTLNPERLLECNKILCTSTTVLNESIDEILSFTKNAEKVSMIGPTAGFIPDPLFERGIDVIGGTYVEDPGLFMEFIRQDKKWGASTRKYCIQKHYYIGFDKLIQNLS
jgi:uncharacterized protein (DUF4213/DUF364 family)